MGCCLSTPATANKSSPRRSDYFKRLKPGHATGSPPFEKETVKEVLPEKPTQNPIPITQNTTQILPENDIGKKSIQENVTEMSEMYSYSENFSAATTTTLTDSKRDVVEIEDDGEVTQRIFTSLQPEKVRKRPEKLSGEISKEKDGGIRVPSRRLVASSPMKKSQSPSNTLQTTHRYGNGGRQDVSRRDFPARRKRPPAIGEQRLNVRERKHIHVKNSGDLRRVNPADNKGNVKVVEIDVSPEPEPRESLDNPVVSMECFIFL